MVDDEWLKLYLQKLDENNKMGLDILQAIVLSLKANELKQEAMLNEIKMNRELIKNYQDSDKRDMQVTINWLKGVVLTVAIGIFVKVYELWKTG